MRSDDTERKRSSHKGKPIRSNGRTASQVQIDPAPTTYPAAAVTHMRSLAGRFRFPNFSHSFMSAQGDAASTFLPDGPAAFLQGW